MENSQIVSADKDGFNKTVSVGDLDSSYEYFRSLLSVMRMERGQLYGALAQLMISTNVDTFVVGNLDALNEIRKHYHVAFTVNENKEMVITLNTHEVIDEQDSGNN